jgi:hypothetical protein
VKNAAYLLPDTEEALEDFTWLQQEIVDAGGGALLLQAQGLGLADSEIEQLFRAERDGDYRKLSDEAQAVADALSAVGELEPGAVLDAERTLRQFQERMSVIRRLDFFGAEQGAMAEAALRIAAERLASRIQPVTGPLGREAPAHAPHGQLWGTRAGVYVDRLACAWVIRRFVDPEARFAFVRPGESLPGEAIPFDIAGVELGHHGARCSVEVIVARYRPNDAALLAVAEVVHDLDLKDEGFGRPEAPGLKRLLDGICAGTVGDPERIERSCPLFEALYQGFLAVGC